MSADTRSGLYFGVGKSGFNRGFEMNIETARMVIRDFTMNDINDMQDILGDAETMKNYCPIFDLSSNEFIGCCGLRPYKKNQYEMGFHLRPKYWGKGYTTEAANAVIDYAFHHFHADGLFAGHNPKNVVSRKVLLKLGFVYIGDKFYAPTGLYHPSYDLKNLC